MTAQRDQFDAVDSRLLDAVQRAAGDAIDIREEARRAGDPPTLVAVADQVRDVLGWQPRYDDLDTIVTHALNWERKLAARDAPSRAAG